MRFFRLFGVLVSVIVFAMASPLRAENTQDIPEEEEADIVDIHFAFFVWQQTGVLTENARVEGIPRIFYQHEQGLRRVPLARNSTTPLLHYRGPMPIEFFDVRRIEVPPPEDAPPETPPTFRIQRYPVATLDVPDTWRQVLFILFPGQRDRNGNVRVLPIRYDLEQVRPDHIRIFNTTRQNILLEAQGELHTLPAQENFDFRPENPAQFNMFRGNFYGRNPDGSSRLMLTSRIIARPESSNLYLLYESGRQLQLMRVGGHEAPPTPTPVPTPEPRR